MSDVSEFVVILNELDRQSQEGKQKLKKQQKGWFKKTSTTDSVDDFQSALASFDLAKSAGSRSDQKIFTGFEIFCKSTASKRGMNQTSSVPKEFSKRH